MFKVMRGRAGSALVWAVSALLVLLVLVGGVLALATRFTTRTLADADHRQAYLTARSAVDAVKLYVDGYSAGIPYGPDESGNIMDAATADSEIMRIVREERPFLAQEQENQPVALEGFAWQANAETDAMGHVVEAGVTKTGPAVWEVFATAEYNGARETVTAVFQMTDETGQSGEEAPRAYAAYRYWFFVQYK